MHEPQGILLINKTGGKTSFALVAALRKALGVRKIGHAGTLDPFATGVMVFMIGKKYTRLSNHFLCQDKEYRACLHLGISTDTFDCEGTTLETSVLEPSLQQVQDAIALFQGEIEQLPPMFSAKKVNGQKLCDLARKGKTVERTPVKVYVETTLIEYRYPFLNLHVKCSKGTYIRSIADELGKHLGCGAHLSALERTRSGTFHLEECLDGALLANAPENASAIREAIKTLT